MPIIGVALLEVSHRVEKFAMETSFLLARCWIRLTIPGPCAFRSKRRLWAIIPSFFERILSLFGSLHKIPRSFGDHEVREMLGFLQRIYANLSRSERIWQPSSLSCVVCTRSVSFYQIRCMVPCETYVLWLQSDPWATSLFFIRNFCLRNHSLHLVWTCLKYLLIQLRFIHDAPHMVLP